jgi:tellurite resistance protein TehA-like permease
MTTLARWSVALTSAATAFAGSAFAAGYSAVEHNDARWRRLTLPTATEWFAQLAPFGVGLAAIFLLANAAAASRRNDAALAVTACLAWLFAFAWVLACLYVWRMPYMLIGER